MTELVLSVPDSLTEEDKARVARLVLERLEKDKREQLCKQREQDALESDDGLARWLMREVVPYKGTMCITRASTYNNSVYTYQEMCRFGRLSDPRRPVVMRGAIHCMIVRHGNAGWGGYSTSANGYAYEVCKRYLRKTKFACFDRETWHDMSMKLGRAMADRYALSYHFWNDLDGGIGEMIRGRAAWVGGRYRFLTDHQFKYLRKLHQTVLKLKHIDKQMEEIND